MEDIKVLVLDQAYQVLGTVEWQRAMTLFFENKVRIVSEYTDKWVHSATQAFKVPSVIAFIKKITKKMRKIKFSRDNVY
ncbi:MAG: hypothetical protein AABY22_16055 [Nanoarchaeota archaeon]